MKKKFHKSGNQSALRRNRLINRMIAQVFAQATSFICLEALEKGKIIYEEGDGLAEKL